MELLEAIMERRSVRVFKKQDLPEELVEKIIDSARRAPSAGNVQPWEFLVARQEATRQRLANAAFNQTYIKEAPVVIVVCADEKRAQQAYGDRGKNLYCIQDTAAAIQNILLTACSLGLGSCWVGAFREEAVKEVINAPEE